MKISAVKTDVTMPNAPLTADETTAAEDDALTTAAMEEAIAEPGDFAFVPAGVIHGLMNLSDTEPAELISCYSVGHRKDAGTVFIEPRWDKK